MSAPSPFCFFNQPLWVESTSLAMRARQGDSLWHSAYGCESLLLHCICASLTTPTDMLQVARAAPSMTKLHTIASKRSTLTPGAWTCHILSYHTQQVFPSDLGKALMAHDGRAAPSTLPSYV
eukprot:5832816-Amphidinium_carterae.2